MGSIQVGRREYDHYTEDQIREAFAFAVELVRDLGVDERAFPPLVVKAVELRTAKQIVFEQVAPGGIRLPLGPAQ